MKKKILFISQDPGGTNALIPVIREIGGRCYLAVLARNNACKIFKDRGVSYSNIDGLARSYEVKELERLLIDFSPDLLVTGTGASDVFERTLWTLAKNLGIKSVAILDSWCNYGLRFSRYTFDELDKYEADREVVYYPDILLTMDSFSQRKLINEGVPQSIIKIVGQPFLRMFKETCLSIDLRMVEEYKKQLTGYSSKKLIVYGSDNLSNSFLPSSMDYWGYDEKSIFECVYEAIENTCCSPDEYAILIRPHPKEQERSWEETLNRVGRGKIDIFIDENTREEVILCASDLVIGMWSMLLVEACLAGKRILSVQIGSKRKSEFVLSDVGVLDPILEKDILTKTLAAYFAGDRTVGKVEWNLVDNSIEFAAETILDMISEGC